MSMTQKLVLFMLASVLSIWPSGPRRRTQVAVVTTAWVRTPQLTMEAIFPLLHLEVYATFHRRPAHRRGDLAVRVCVQQDAWVMTMTEKLALLYPLSVTDSHS